MNGRCEVNPFDRAVDVCRACFGEFCQECLLETKPKRDPLCRDCALIVGGLRPKAKPKIRGSKKTAKSRREALRSVAAETQSDYFQFFDSQPEPAPQAASPAPQDLESYEFDMGGLEIHGLVDPTKTPPPPQSEPEVAVAESAAIQRLTSIRRSGRLRQNNREAADTTAPTAEADPAPTPPKPAPEPLPLRPITADYDEAEFRRPRPFIEERNRATAEAFTSKAPAPIAAPTPPVHRPAEDEEPVEPVSIHDDPWSRTGPDVVHEAPQPTRSTETKPAENLPAPAPAWTRKDLPKRR